MKSSDLLDMLKRVVHEYEEGRERETQDIDVTEQPGVMTLYEVPAHMMGKLSDYDPTRQSLKFNGQRVTRVFVGTES